MTTTILAENALGGIVGDTNGKTYCLGAFEMGNLSEDDANFYIPVKSKDLQEFPEEFPELKEYAAPEFGLTVKAGFSEDESLWYVLI